MHLETFVSLVVIVTLRSFPSVLSASIFMPLLHLFVIPVIGISISVSVSVPVSVTYTAPGCCLPLSGFLDDVRVESLPARFIRCNPIFAFLLFAVPHHDGSLLETVAVVHNFEGSNVFAPHSAALDSRAACNAGKMFVWKVFIRRFTEKVQNNRKSRKSLSSTLCWKAKNEATKMMVFFSNCFQPAAGPSRDLPSSVDGSGTGLQIALVEHLRLLFVVTNCRRASHCSSLPASSNILIWYWKDNFCGMDKTTHIRIKCSFSSENIASCRIKLWLKRTEKTNLWI